MGSLLALALAAGACGANGALPCTSCPQVAGTYALRYAEAVGTEECAEAVRHLPPTLTLTQVDSQLRATLGPLELGGRVYDTFDFGLTGVSGTGVGAEAVEVRGHFVPGASGEADQLVGDWRHEVRQEDGTCRAWRDFTAERQP